MSAALHFDDATVGYRRHPALHHVTVDVAAGELTAVVGPNGAGKSTLLKAAVGLLKPMSGAVSVEGCRRREIAYLPQQAEVDRTFPIAVFDFVAMGLLGRRGLFGGFRRVDDEAVAGALAAVGLAGFEARTLDTLSGGRSSASCSPASLCRTPRSSSSTSPSRPSTSGRPPISWRSSCAGTARDGRSSPSFTTSTSCGATSPGRCSSPAGWSPRDAPPTC